MKTTTFIGIDISSATLDIAVKQQAVSLHQIKNEPKAIARFFKTYNCESTVIAMENTGNYNWFLYEVLGGYGLPGLCA